MWHSRAKDELCIRLTPGSISVAVDRLEKKALVKRKNTDNRRVRLVELTAKGRAHYQDFSGARDRDGRGRRRPPQKRSG